MELHIGQNAKHKLLYNGKESYKIVGIRKEEVELEGDYETATHFAKAKKWMPIKGLILQNRWGNWVDKETEIDFTKNTGQRD